MELETCSKRCSRLVLEKGFCVYTLFERNKVLFRVEKTAVGADGEHRGTGEILQSSALHQC